jgi:hypothetical protein
MCPQSPCVANLAPSNNVERQGPGEGSALGNGLMLGFVGVGSWCRGRCLPFSPLSHTALSPFFLLCTWGWHSRRPSPDQGP